jgi:DNA-binding IclR family transcriptional regulator
MEHMAESRKIAAPAARPLRADLKGVGEVPRRPSVAALSRGLWILQCFTDDAQLGTREIARRVELPVPTVWRLCQALVGEGFLIQDPQTGKLSPGLAVLTLGQAALIHKAPGELASHYLQEFANKHDCWTALTVADGLDMVYLTRSRGGQGPHFLQRPPGARVAILGAPAGWAYLALLAEPERSELLGRLRVATPDLHRKYESVLPGSLRLAEQSGFLRVEDLPFPGLNTLAVGRWSRTGDSVYSVVAGGPADHVPPARFEELGKALLQLTAVILPIFKD